MKSSKFCQLFMRKTVKLFFLIVFTVFSVFSSKGNVLVIDHTIMEFYYNSGDWSIELFFDFDVGDGNLENMRMTGLYDTAQFLPREYNWHEPFIVTQADFETQFDINPEGDWLFIEILIENEWFRIDEFGLNFGEMANPEDTWVSAPVGEESVAWQLIYCYDPPFGYNYWWTVKELPHTFGLYPPCEVSKRATFSGYVLDKNDNPLPGINLNYCSFEYQGCSPTLPVINTDSSGYFYTDEMFCRKFQITFLSYDDEIADTTIYVEPDSANYFVFKLDTLLNGMNELKSHLSGYTICNIPNPASVWTKFVVKSKFQAPNQKGVIKIYNETGYIIDIIPIEFSGTIKEVGYSIRDKFLSSGIYFYNLEMGKEKKASGKMIISQ